MERDQNLIAYCGFYCGACPKYKQGKHNCQGCRGDHPLCLDTCKVRPCNLENGYFSCADCKTLDSVAQCRKYNPFLIRFGEWLVRSSRGRCIEMLKARGQEEFVEFMADNGLVSHKKIRRQEAVNDGR